MDNAVKTSRRTIIIQILGAIGLAGCGFKLRGSQNFAFSRIAITPYPGDAVAAELRRALEGRVQVMTKDAPLTQSQIVLDIHSEQREKVVVGVNASGQVREFQLRIRVRFGITSSKGVEIVADDEILLQRDFSYNESAALAKETEEALLYQDMQSDIVQQILRRLSSISQIE